MKTTIALVVAALGTGVAGGYLWGARAHARALGPAPALPGRDASEIVPAGTASPRSPADYQAIKNQLAICMAYHPSENEKDKQLTRCKWDLEACRTPPHTIQACYDFIDLAPVYDLELGEGAPSPETSERAKSLWAVVGGEVAPDPRVMSRGAARRTIPKISP
jgi:hypothetical protein